MKYYFISIILITLNFACQDSKKNSSYEKSDVEISDTINLNKSDSQEPKPKQYARITTTDNTGYKTEKINVWSSVNTDRIIIDRCVDNEIVEVLEYSDPYVKIKKKNGKEGWFMEGWIKEYLK